ncbi:ATP phosphoribosyltransferase regulatory subunit [Maritimibacter sp. 55A14]|uniref:ATP phosphoribosyltransferase regulatory subunit n=1 Tax=Maritimibacter sp. 55A14 TaxID=2174844 RepID=UPI000D61E19E|nr:ATP phosphoribosyltransferase regulatory subunit [Maritimibacter sp. 55A14]PWE32088.1 ATP phosphoribosyltransferase regulatory subunit [Maritimibacter sp. 55A14]
MVSAARLAERAEAERLLAVFTAAGAVQVEADLLQPAGTLLDLYGEDIRARAYTTRDPVRGEMMLRPDFTVPVVQMHMAEGAEPARYAYAGPVFRMQEEESDRACEYMQVGYEVFDGADPAAADAEVFALFAETLAPLGLTASTGDIGVLTAAVAGLSTTARRKAALMRHIWRPRRFRALLDRFGGRSAPPATRTALLAAAEEVGAEALIAAAGPVIGLRGSEEIAARIEALRADAAEPPVPEAERDVIERILALRGTMDEALRALETLAAGMPALTPALDRLAARRDALAARGVAAGALGFEASYGRTALEYYDGFVFGFGGNGTGRAPVATGGRYDALTRVLGQGREIQAVGGVIRPAEVLEAGR